MLSAITCVFQKDRFLAPAADLGRLEPKGRTNPDGSEVWGFPEGSGLEEMIEVHIKDGRVIREVLQPSSRISADAFRDS